MTVFVSGIDTGVGKTVATGLLARALRAAGDDAITVKLVQTGCDDVAEDLLAHRVAMGCGPLPEDAEGLTAPAVFRFPASPALAARLEGRRVDLDAIDRAVAACERRRGTVLAEGAGGLLVPLDGDTLAADFAAARAWPLVLVSCGRLGSLNHTILSLEAARARGLEVAGVVWNWHPETDPAIDEDSRAETLRHLHRLGFPEVLVRVPRVADPASPPPVDFTPLLAQLAPAAKRAWRAKARALAAAHAADPPAPDPAAAVMADPAWRGARVVALYAPHGPAEPDTAGLLAACRREGRTVVLPAWNPVAKTYFWAVSDPDEPLGPGPLGIPQPVSPRRVETAEIDLFAVPGLLFDETGTRLGHGAGHFDRLLEGRRADAAVLGLALPWQVVPRRLPRGPHDVPADRVLA